MKTAIVQGASRGIGLGMVQRLLEASYDRVHATCRTPESAEALQALRDTFDDRLHVHRLDVTRDETLASALSEIAALSPKVHLLFNSTGILHEPGQSPERRLEDLDRTQLLHLFEVNSVGPLLVTKTFLPLLRHDERSVVASLSARVGSIEDNGRGGWYGYRSSKAALNQLHKSLAVELSRRIKRAISVVLHPGTVETKLTEPFRRSVPEGKLFSVETSTRKLMALIEGLTPEDHGKFFDYDKRPIPW